MTNDPLELSWLAGLFDGEGCVMINERIRRRGNSMGVNYHTVVALNMTHAPTIARLMSLTGIGACHTTAPASPRKRRFDWRATNAAAEEFLSAILPYSVTKRAEIECCLEAAAIRKMDSGGARRKRLNSDTLAVLKDSMVKIKDMKLVQFDNLPQEGVV